MIDIAIFFGIMSIVGIIAAVAIFRAERNKLLSMSWPNAQGRILRIAIRGNPRGGEDGPHFYPDIQYEYSVNGRRHVGTRYTFETDKSFVSYSDAIDALAGLNKGTEVKVYYDPTNPAVSVLMRGREASKFMKLSSSWEISSD